jgi:hypothetical protein
MVISSATIALIPLLPPLNDYFVNGLAYFDNPMLEGSHNKAKHLAILREHYGKFKAKILSWERIKDMVADMFSRFDNSPVVGSKVHFYGNSGVCLFKFFVREDDPQKRFTWFVIIKNALCFFAITISYLIIHATVRDSSRKVFQGSMKKTSTGSISHSQAKQSQKNRALNRKITLMVLSDFLCWVPFIVVCGLHYYEVVDATEWYSLFSIIILPLNSVINPLLYDNSGIMDYILKVCTIVSGKCRNIKSSPKDTTVVSHGIETTVASHAIEDCRANAPSQNDDIIELKELAAASKKDA